MLVASLLVNALTLNGQPGADGGMQATAADIIRAANAGEAFPGLQNAGRDEMFAQFLKQVTADAGDTYDALDAQGSYFYDQFRAALGDAMARAVEKGKEINRAEREKRKSAASGKRTGPKRIGSKRVYGKNVNELLSILSSEPTPGDIQITKVETDNSFGGTSQEVKVIDSADATTTNTQNAGTLATYNKEDMSMTTSTKFDQKSESVSKTSLRKASKVSNMEWSTTFQWCPDAEGLVRGKGRARIYNQTTINTGRQLAAGTTEYTLEFNIKGQVNDDAVMPTFDMEGVVAEKITGFERGVRLGLLNEKPGYTDGSASVVYNINGNTPPGTEIVLGRVNAKLFGVADEVHAQRISKFANWGINSFVNDLDGLMKSAISRWTNGECVEVECTAPKTALKPNETVQVTAASVSHLDKGKFSAKLNGNGTESVTPEDQEGTPSAVYILTAPAKGQARIIVKSVSRRGIGLGMLEFDEVKKPKPPVKTPPVKTPPCDGGWTGTVKAVHVKRRDERKGQDGRLVRQIDTLSETYDAKVTVLGTRDLSGGIVNNFHGNAEGSFFSTKYSESNYAPGKMFCNKVMMETPQTKKLEIQEKGEANKNVLVAIAINGGRRGYIGFTAPETASELIITRTYESNCESYNAVNSGVDRSSSLIERNGHFFEVHFEIDPSSPNVLKGSKTIQNSDGSETMITWDLSRCR